MRYRWIYGAVAIVTMLSLPAVSHAQQANPCDAYASDSTNGGQNPTGRPTCSVQKNATATIGNLLKLAVINPDIRLLQDGSGVAADTLPFYNTWVANGNAAGATGTNLAAQATSLFASSDTNLVIAQGNRAFTVQVKALNPIFDFDATGTCRKSATAQTHCGTGEALAGKPVGDVYLHPEAGHLGGLWVPLKTTDQTLFSSTTGARFTSGIELASAWYYATDIAGDYTATLVYTITGQ
jgi:hypothetical protein